MMFTEAFGQFGMMTPDYFGTVLKGTGIFTGIAAIIFICIKFKVIYILAVDEATEVLRTRWGVARRYRFGKRRGRLIRLKAGRHLMVRGIHHGWEVSRKEVVLPVESVSQPYRGRTLTYDRITIGYEVIAPDSTKGDQSLLRYVLSVRDGDREGMVSENLDQKIVGIVIAALGSALRRTEADEYGVPDVRLGVVEQLVRRRLRKKHGVRLVSFDAAAPTWTQGDQTVQAAHIVADALLGKLTPTNSAASGEAMYEAYQPTAEADAAVLPLPVQAAPA